MLEQLYQKILEHGGFVNAHSHLDRANTARFFSKEEQYKFLEEKWKLVDRIKKESNYWAYYSRIDNAINYQIKKESNYWAYYSRIDHAINDQIKKDVKTICSFIDVDPIVNNQAYLAAIDVANNRKFEVTLITAMQTLKGVLNPNYQELMHNAACNVNIIGSLPGGDRGREDEHIDWIMNAAKRYGKRVHVHVDQLNTPKEKETEWLARKTIEHGLEDKVTAVHSISLACHPITYRKEVYKICQDAGLSFITCPGAWIDHPRREDLAPIHNAITPVDELLEHDLIVAIGSDNIYDVYKPFANGDMMFELRLLLEACKIYNIDQLVKIATTNGKKTLGLR